MKQFILSAVCMLLGHWLAAQTCRVLIVSATDGRPVSGASVAINGKTIAVAKGDGSFEIDCSKADNLYITASGFTAATITGTAGSLPPVIKMQPLVKQLDDVQVSTGYQQLPKERATGSFEIISNKLYNEQTGTTVLDRLESIANGLYFDKKTSLGNTRINIHGLSTIQGPRAPLIILDDFPYEGDIAAINPNDVETITILKDAAASSIWGTRAGNGVIVITTKKAKLNQPLRVELNSNITIGNKPDLFYYNNISSSDFIDAEQFLYSKGYYNSQINSTARTPLSPVVELLIKKANGSMPAAEADARINTYRTHDTRDDFNRYMYRQMINQQYAVTLRGGTNKATYLFTAGYDGNSSNLDDKYRRISFKTENSFNISSRLQLLAGVSYTNSQAKAGRTGYNNTSTVSGILPPYIMMADSNGNAIPVMKQYRLAYTDTAGAGKLLNWNYYLLDDYKYVQNTSKTGLLIGNLGINYKIFRSLTVAFKYRYELQDGDNDILYDEQSFLARDQVNTFSQLNRATGVVTYIVPKGGKLSTNNAKQQSHNFRGQLSYNTAFKNHEINAIAGAESRQMISTGSTYRTYGYKPSILAFTPVDFVNQYPRFVNGALGSILNDQDFSEKLNRFISLYANVAYSYKNRYGLSLSGRRDASNLYGVRTNDKWTPLWSTGVSWDISKENWFRFTTMSFCKLRATYGVSGNADPSKSGFTVLSYISSSPYTQLPTASFNQFANPDLRWEKNYMLNLGIDFKAFKNRLQGSVEYYRKNGKDLLGFAAVDYTAVPANRIAKT